MVLSEDFPLVAADEAPAGVDSGTTGSTGRPVAALRDRYASGEIDRAEFDRRLDRLFETEDLDERFDRIESDRAGSDGTGDRREREYEPD